MIEQIPRSITCASITHSRLIRTSIATFSIHTISPNFFFGFDWYRQTGDFLIATPEKALLDCYYLSGRKKKQFGHLLELEIPEDFDFKKICAWIRKIHDRRLRKHVQEKYDTFLSSLQS